MEDFGNSPFAQMHSKMRIFTITENLIIKRKEQIRRTEINRLRQDFLNRNYDEDDNNNITLVLSGDLDDWLINLFTGHGPI